MRFSCTACQATFQTADAGPRAEPLRCPACGADMAAEAQVYELRTDRDPTRRYDVEELRARLEAERAAAAELARSPAARTADQIWFVGVQGRQVGPLTLVGLSGLRTRDQLGPSSLVWRDGFADWVPAETVADLRPLLGLPPQTPATPFAPAQATEVASAPAAGSAAARAAALQAAAARTHVPAPAEEKLSQEALAAEPFQPPWLEPPTTTTSAATTPTTASTVTTANATTAGTAKTPTAASVPPPPPRDATDPDLLASLRDPRDPTQPDLRVSSLAAQEAEARSARKAWPPPAEVRAAPPFAAFAEEARGAAAPFAAAPPAAAPFAPTPPADSAAPLGAAARSERMDSGESRDPTLPELASAPVALEPPGDSAAEPHADAPLAEGAPADAAPAVRRGARGHRAGHGHGHGHGKGRKPSPGAVRARAALAAAAPQASPAAPAVAQRVPAPPGGAAPRSTAAGESVAPAIAPLPQRASPMTLPSFAQPVPTGRTPLGLAVAIALIAAVVAAVLLLRGGDREPHEKPAVPAAAAQPGER